MKISGEKISHNSYKLRLTFDNEHTASVFQAIMQEKITGKIFPEYVKEAKEMAKQIADACETEWE